MTREYQSRQERKKSQKQDGKKKKKSKNQGLFKKILVIFLFLILLSGIGGGITVFSMVQGAPNLDPALLEDPQSSTLFDMNDEEFMSKSGVEHREKVKIQDVPDVVKDAFIATEDVRFYDHFGIDLKRIGGAVLANFQEGFGAEGASTITQQVVKNSFLSPEKSLSRKVQEAYLSLKLEQNYSKDQILEMYLNKIYFANRAYGVKTAAETYFQKSIEEDEITIAEAALLAGLPQRPSYYDPFKNPEAAEERRNTVISLMEKHGFITADQAAEAKAIPVAEMVHQQTDEQPAYEAFMDQLAVEIEQIDGVTQKDLYEGGLKIYTTIDTDAQDYVETLLKTDTYISYPDDRFEAGVTLLDTQTGAIRAIGGGRNKDEESANRINFAIPNPALPDSGRQPGSTIKPILDYGPAIEDFKWSTGEILKDQPLVVNGSQIQNWDGKHRGTVTMRKALEWSYNVPAVNAFLEVGEERAKEFADNLGIHLDTIYPSYAIGGFETGITPLELAGAYAAFGNEGVYNTPHTIRKIEFPDGRVINLEPEPTAAMSDYTAYMITDMLRTVVDSGTGTQANISGLDVAGKTGTTNLPDNYSAALQNSGVKDAWFAGYTTNYTAAIWTGYNKTTQEDFVRYSNGGDDISKEIFKQLISYVSKNQNTPDFKQPNSVVRIGVERGTNLLPSEYTPSGQIVSELFVRGHEPNKVSKRFDQPDTPSNLAANYNAESNTITLTWSYPGNTEASFRIKQSIENGGYQTISETADMSLTISNVEKGKTYQFQVSAVEASTGIESPAVSAQVTIPEDEKMEEEEDIPNPLDEEKNVEDDETSENEEKAPDTDEDDNKEKEEDKSENNKEEQKNPDNKKEKDEDTSSNPDSAPVNGQNNNNPTENKPAEPLTQ
ncbi:PBP1A family penicillin-binding protein [Bacillus taeanensis]|uniref:Penicillin-binding protein n=1 Tax=Bacillus taeanensis TaxID=273032 RepID=A0A366XZT8_9BACI|nr:PBP1A family penicillin-binding protein [Bacillus taeanensis]RBW69431.1 penicillin-binding protein [Bacillus taeanensis]